MRNLQPDPERRPLDEDYYPGFETVKPEWARQSQGRMQAAVRSVMAIEDVLIREWEMSSTLTGEQILGVARSYRLASEYENAMSWFNRALGETGLPWPPPPDLAREVFATAVLTEDSLTVTREVLNLAGISDLHGYDSTVILALRYLIAAPDSANLVLLQDKLDGQVDRLAPETRWWYGFSLATNGRDAQALAVLRGLLPVGAREPILTPRRQRWLLRAIPDLFLVLGRAAEARRLYAALADGDSTLSGEAGAWARYQTANFLLTDGDYARAGELYAGFRDLADPAPWQRRAAAMSELATTLQKIKTNGEPYGVDALHDR